MSNANPHPSTAGTAEALSLGACLDLPHATSLREELLARAALGDVAIDLAGVTTCDLAGLQLLVAARATAAARQQRCVLIAPSPAVLAACTTFGLDLGLTHHS